jgi:hypothetical protein
MNWRPIPWWSIGTCQRWVTAPMQHGLGICRVAPFNSQRDLSTPTGLCTLPSVGGLVRASWAHRASFHAHRGRIFGKFLEPALAEGALSDC